MKAEKKIKTWAEMTKKEREECLGEATRAEIARHHVEGRATAHGDEKGVYWLYPDGHKEYTKIMDIPLLPEIESDTDDVK
jgi:hypothetical protein